MNKKIIFSLQLSLAVASVNAQKYVVERHKDKHGFTYTTVSNDPVGLRTYKLKNGLTVYLAKKTDSRTAYYATTVRAGSRYDPIDNTGLAHYLEHLLFNGTSKIGSLDWEKEAPLLKKIETLTENRKATNDSVQKNVIYKMIDSISYLASQYGIKGEYRNLVASLGSESVNGVTNNEIIAFGTLTPSASLKKLLLLEKERFSDPVFRAFHTELEIVYEEYNSRIDNSFLQKFETLNKLIFPTHPYGSRTNIGTAEHLKKPSLLAIREYYNTYFVPNNMSVTLVGDINFDSTILWVEDAFGHLQSKPITHNNYVIEEAPISTPIETELTNTFPESVFLGFRLNGIGSEDEKYFTLIAKMFENNAFNMLQLSLTKPKKLNTAYSYSFFKRNDYSVHYLEGYPNPGQSLEDVKLQLLSVIEKLKQGDFEEWLLTACAKEIKRDFIEKITGNDLDAATTDLFSQFREWDNQLKFIDTLSRITKKDLIAFVNKAYKNNYAVIYKRKGVSNVAKAENPKITPIVLNEKKESAFSKQFKAIPTPLNAIETIDYTKKINTVRLKNGIQVSHVQNNKSDQFYLDIYFKMGGRNNGKMISLAISYLPFLGTNRYTADELKKEMYKLGIQFTGSTTKKRTIFRIEGSQENFAAAIQLVDHVMNNLQLDTAAYTALVQNIINSRKSTAANRSQIVDALTGFALYEENSAARAAFTEQELRDISPQTLTNLIKDIRSYPHLLYYYGNDLPNTLATLNQNYHIPKKEKPYPAEINNAILPTNATVYFANFPGAQTDVTFISRAEKFNAKNIAYYRMLNNLIGQAVFQQIREARSLAYNAWAWYQKTSDSTGYNYLKAYAGTQTNKLSETLKVMDSIIRDISWAASLFNDIKKTELEISRSTITKQEYIFWTFEDLKQNGIRRDLRKEQYHQIEQMSFADLKKFFNSNFSGNNFTLLIVGDKKEIDMKELEKYGTVKEVDIKELFNFK